HHYDSWEGLMNVRLGSGYARLGACALAVLAALLSTSAAQAALLAYEPFNYPSGATIFTNNVATATVASGGGAFGWVEPWRSNGNGSVTNTTIVAGSFSYSVGGRTLQTAGNRFWSSGNPGDSGDKFTAGGVNTISPAPFRRLTLANSRGYSTTADTT